MYGTVNGADAYLGTRIGGSIWLNLPTTTKTEYLNSAHDIIETLPYSGEKTDADQDDQFPRDGETEVPTAVINAEYQLANCLLVQGINPGEASNSVLKRSKTGPIETEFFNIMAPMTLQGVACPRAYALLKDYIVDPNELTLVRES